MCFEGIQIPISYWMSYGSLFFEELVHFIKVVEFVCVDCRIPLLLRCLQSLEGYSASCLILVICVFSFLLYQFCEKFVNFIGLFQDQEPALHFIGFLYYFYFH